MEPEMSGSTRRRSVARRIHFAFMIATAAPLLLLAVSTYQMASSRLERLALDNAHHLAKSVGMTLFDRLQFVSDQLLLLNAYGTTAGQPEGLADLHLDERVLGVLRIDGGEVSGTISLDALERIELASAANEVMADRP